MSVIYLIGSLRNPKIPQIGCILRADGHDVFDDWHAGGKEADDEWKHYESVRGRSYKEALDGYPAWHAFDYDRHHIHRCEIGVLVCPAGKSGHLELGYMIGRGQRGYILMEGEPDPDRWDLMYKFAHGIAMDVEELQDMVR